MFPCTSFTVVVRCKCILHRSVFLEEIREEINPDFHILIWVHEVGAVQFLHPVGVPFLIYLDKEAINLQLQEAKKFLQDNIKGISRESDNFAQMFYYCGIIYGLDDIYNCGDYEFVKVGIEVRKYIIKVQNGDMDDELEADLYDKLTKLTADDIQEVVNAIDN